VRLLSALRHGASGSGVIRSEWGVLLRRALGLCFLATICCADRSGTGTGVPPLVGKTHAPPRAEPAGSLASSAAAPPDAPIDPRVAAATATLDRKQFERDLRFLAKPRHHTAAPGHLRDAARHIEAELGRAGLRTQRQEVVFDGARADNIIADGPGKDPDQVVIVCAHYDAVVGSPGADDNASGVAAVLAVARALAPIETRASLRAVAFAFEEQGLVGSRRYVASLDKAERARVAGVFNIEMIGYATRKQGSQRYPEGLEAVFPPGRFPTTGDFIGAIGKLGDGGLSASLEDARAYVPALRVETVAIPGFALALAPDLLRSDHAPFWLAGIPAVMIGDTADFRSPHYHQASDKVETLDLGFADAVVRWLNAAVLLRLEPSR